MDRRRAAGVLLALAACVAYATAAPTASNHTSLDVYDGAPDGCYYNFQHYGESDRIMTNEPCLNCTCHNRMLMCYLRVCPFTKPIGQDCTIEKRADQCCPIVTCPDVPVDLLTSTTTSPAEYGSTGLGKLDKYGCSIHGKYFPEGSKVPPTPNKPCEHCYCIRNMTTCVMQECTLHVDGCTPIYHKDVCCPVRYSCDHPEDEMPLLDDLSTTVRPTPGFLLTTTTLSPVTQMSQDCLYENQIIPDGALIKTEKACDHCYCMKGDIVCVVQECGTPMENEGKNCSALAPREGVCCPDTYICEGDESTTGTYEGLDYTTELEQEIHTTLLPPRRAGSEGSGYRNEPGEIPKTELLETETEGSGDEEAIIRPTFVTLTDSQKMGPADTISSSTEEPHEFITFTTSKAPVSEYEDASTESDKHKDTSETQQYIPSTTSTYSSQQSDELSTTKAQDGDVGSGEEDIIIPHEIVPTSSDSPTIDESEPAVTIEQNVATDSNKEDNYESMTSAPTVVEDQTNLTKEQSIASESSAVDITTETHHHLDEFKSTTTIEESEQSSLRTTTSVPIMEKDETVTMASAEKDKIDVHYETDTQKTFDPQHYSTSSTSSPSSEDEIATTDSQNIVTDSFEGAEADFDPHHQIMTASTPLLEEIEKDTTDQENILDDKLDKHKTSTTSTNIFIEETTNKDSLKPDLLDETIATNILTTISPFDSDDVTTAEPQTSQEAEVEESSEPQHYVPVTSPPVFDDESKKTTLFDSLNISDPQKGQAIEVEESSEPQQYSSTTSAAVLEDENKKTTFSDSINTSKPQKAQESDVEDSSEPQQYPPIITASDVNDETKESDSLTTLEPQETDVEGSSDPQQLAPTTNAPNSDDEIRQTMLSESITTSEPKKSQETNIEESSEHQHYTTTTSASTFIDESKKTILLESITTLEPQKVQETENKESSEPQQYATSTSAPAFDNEVQKTTASESITTQESQKGHEADFEESSESQLYSPTTNAPAFGDENKKTTPLESISTSESEKSQETDVEETSKLHHNAPTTNVPALEDESQKTTSSESITTSESQKGPEKDVKESLDPQIYSPTTNAPILEDKNKKTTQSDIQFITDAVFEDNDAHETSSATSSEQNEITTAEPDKGLNTIPSGSVEEETTESPEVETYTKLGDIITEKATELDNKLGDEIESITDEFKFTTSIPDTSGSQEDQLSLTTESIVNENVNSTGLTATHDIAEQTTVLFDVSEEGMTHPSSTKSHVSVYHETGTTPVPSNTENVKETAEPITTVTYESSTQATGSEETTSEKHEIKTPSYATMPETSTANLEENEIINEPRIPGEGDCLLNGVTYRNESTVPSTNKCQSGCRCSSSIIKCDPILCSPPPEYMNNCQTTYDSPDSCCPTYVCDHKTETMPPQSHSQMSGTEAPAECNGDECVLSQDKNQSEEKPALCDSGSCITQDETSSHQSNVPVQPAVDQQEGCTGDKCTSSESSVQLCSQENGCQASPVKPCEGTECEIGHDTILPQKQQPCADGDNCDIPVQDCSAGKCSPDALNAEKKPNEKICISKEDCKDQLDIETECSEKSCKRKDDFPSEQQPPKKCSGSECQSTDFISGVELTTASTQKEVEREEQTQSTDNPESETEKPEKSSKLPSIDSDRTTRPIEDKTEEPSQIETMQPGKNSENPTTTIRTDVTTKLPDLVDQVKISTVSESATASGGQGITDSPAPYLPESTKIFDNEIDTEAPIYSPDIYKTEKQDDTTTETEDNVNTDSLTMVTKESETESTKASEEAATPSPELKLTNPPKTQHTEFSESFKPTETEESTNKIADTITTVSSFDTETQEVNKSPIHNENDEITTKIPGFNSEPQEVTKSPQESEDEGTTIRITEEIGSTPSKTYDSDLHEPTESPEVSVRVEVTTQRADDADTSQSHDTDQEIMKAPEEYQSEEKTTQKSTDEITTNPEFPEVVEETTKTSIGDERDEITTHSLEKLSTDSPKLYDEENEVTKSPDSSLHEKTTITIDDMRTDTSRRSDTEETTQSSFKPDTEETATKIAENVLTDTLKPHDTEMQEVTTSSFEETESGEANKKSTVTEPSTAVDIEEQKATKSPGSIEVTTIDETGTESPKHDDLSHDTTVSQQETEKDLTSSKNNEKGGTESPQLVEYEPLSTTTSPNDFDDEKTTAKVTKESDVEPPKLDNLEPQEVTQSSESESMPPPDTITSISTEDKHKYPSESHPLEINTTLQADTVFELTTLSILVPDSKSTEPERTINEITTELQEQSHTTESPTQSATESLDHETATASVSPIYKDEGVSSISDRNMLTETPLNLVTKPEPHSEVTTSHKIMEDDTTAVEIGLSSVTDLPNEHETKMPEGDRKTTEAIVELEEITKKPTPTGSFDDKLQEDVKTEIPVLHETEKDIISEATTSKPIDETYDIDKKTELPNTTLSSKEKPAETSNISTEKPYNAEKATTEAIIEEPKTKIPVDFEIDQENQTDKSIIREQEPIPTALSEIDTPGKDKLETETPSITELITLMPVDEDKLTERPIDIIKETEITQNPDFSTKSTEPEEEIYTQTPSQGISVAADTETPYKPGKGVDEELTTPAIQIYDSTAEPSKVPTDEMEISSDVYTEKPTETTHKESLEPAVTEQSEVVSSTSRSGAGDRETETILEISSLPESSTRDQTLTEIYQLSTESPKETYTGASGEKITTEGPVMVETEKTYESFTESEEKITKETEMKIPEQDNLEPTATESAEQFTKAQDQGDNENVEVATSHTTSDETPTSLSVLNITEAVEAIETSTKLSDIITSQPVEDIEKSSDDEHPSTSKQELTETTTSVYIDDENISPIVKESTEIPITTSDQQVVEIVTERQPALIDTATTKQETVPESMEDEFTTSKTSRTEMYSTTLSAAEESEKSTSSPVIVEVSTATDQTMLTSIEPHVSEEEPSAFTVVSEMDKTSTLMHEFEEHTEKVTAPTKKPVPSPETLAPEEEKPTSPKAEEISTASPVFDKFTEPTHKPTEAPATEQPRPVTTEEQPTEDLLTPDEEPSIPPSGTSGYGTDPDYMEEDQTFGPGTCRYGGKVYVSAQQIPRDDPCDFCFCFRSDIICLQQSCPPPIHGCHEEPISGFCCPRYECPVSMATTVNVTTTTTTTTTTLPPHFPVHSYKGSAQKRGCLIKGHTYKVGEVVRASSGPCLHCTCGGDGQMKCDPKQCTPEPMLRQMIAAAVSAKRRR